ncbi:alpha/beta fold hydrolase [Bdellovibrio bacteriovorus]|uniref:alpha/beta fold hydrolase n=1 Tax=Bdellovibrio bacteriovorus TaxID=959 RepID=UPI0035A6EA00
MKPLETIVLLPGFLCDERLWAPLVPVFSERYNVRVVDLKHPQNLEAMIEEVGKTADKVFHLVGFSMGGYIAETFATRFPERVLSLSLVAASVGALSEKTRAARLKMVGLLRRGKYNGISEKEMDRYIHPDFLKDPQVFGPIMQMSADFSSEQYINQTLATVDRIDQGAALQELSFPVLIVAAANDRVVPLESLKNRHAQITRSKFQIIDHCGHYVPLEQPAELGIAVLDFVGGQW